MGVFGTGLYSGDFAMDLRSTIGAVARLPLDGDRLLDILSVDLAEEDASTFWLVAADQFHKKGIHCARLKQKAIEIVNDGSDLAMLKRLGMTGRDLQKRRKVLADLRARLLVDAPERPRNTLKKPQPFLMDVGEVYAYPVSRGRAINPYKPSLYERDGWSAMLIAERGRAFDFLSWYRPLTLTEQLVERPNFDKLLSDQILWKLGRPGTCSALHLRRMELAKLGTVAVSGERFASLFPSRLSGDNAAIDDISIANGLNVAAPVAVVRGRTAATIQGLTQLRQ